MKNDNIKIIPLGGCGEIGMNMTLFCFYNHYFFVDCGALFPDDSHVGVDLITPSTKFIDEHQIVPEAWIITHGHEDHIGAMPVLFKKYPAPIYSTAFTIELIKAKFEDANIHNAVFHTWKFFETHYFKNVKITCFPVNHSIADASGLFFESPLGNVLHMGDFRIDSQPPEGSTTHENLKRVLKNKTVHLMMSDSTNVNSLGTDRSEGSVSDSLKKYFLNKDGAVIISTFASNIWRLKSVIECAKETNRKVILFGRSMHRNMDIAKKLGLIGYHDNLIAKIEKAASLPRNQICLLCTGSQGEMFSGLHRIAWGTVDSFELQSEDTIVLSSRIIPGNEKVIDNLITQIERLGCEVVTVKEDRNIHVSGHGYQEDLKKCIQIAKPISFMPVHGTYRHLKRHRDLAIECNVSPENSFLVENGDVLIAAPRSEVGIVDKINSGRDYLIPGGLFSQNSSIYKERIALSAAGFIAVSFVLIRDSYHLACEPVISAKGVPVNIGNLIPKMVSIFNKTQEHLSKQRKQSSDSAFQEELRVAIRRYLERLLNYKAVVVILLNRL